MEETKTMTRLVDKAKNPAHDFISGLSAALRGEYTLLRYGVESQYYDWSEQETASVKLPNGLTVTLTVSRSK